MSVGTHLKIQCLDTASREVVSRWRDPQLQVSGNYSQKDLTKWRSTVLEYC